VSPGQVSPETRRYGRQACSEDLDVRVGKRSPAAIQPLDADDELDLVRRAVAHDRDAFRALFERHHARVYRYALLRVGDAEAARDVAQEVFTAVWSGLPGFAPEHAGSFPAWLFGIARNVVGTHHRRTHRAVPVPDDDLPEGAVEFEGELVTRRLLIDALRALPVDQREVLVLRFLVGLPTSDVAGTMRRSEGAVTALQLRAMDKLRRRLEVGS
jgi:RNA polymerase sigma-70 factor (ECF subfamily)